MKNESISLASKLEVIYNIEIPNELRSSKERSPIPDYFWQDTTLDRKIRALCRAKSQTYANVPTQGYDYNKVNIWYERVAKDSDEELFLGLSELLDSPLYLLFDSSQISLEQKEIIVRNAINFKRSFNLQNGYHEYTLLYALEVDCFSEEIQRAIYEAAKQNMLKTGHYADTILKGFFNRFYKDTTVSDEDKIRMIKLAFPDLQGNDYSNRYVFYLGNKNIPSFIQRIVLNHFASATGYNLEKSYPNTFRQLAVTSFVNMISDPEIPDDLKAKLIESNTNPVMLSYGITEEGVNPRIAELLIAKLETLKIAETADVLEVIRALLSNPDVSIKRLMPNQDSQKQSN